MRRLALTTLTVIAAITLTSCAATPAPYSRNRRQNST
ncbi:hypothetical protein BKA10_002150 [Microbacterium invictum]|uniref:Uncharacterized protein n=1 Tax=Microbacterium invictum TaxID=515415 RepID=A0AA40VME4_9MICO|nr:hypothetical protein [Microbacterium invictum]